MSDIRYIDRVSKTEQVEKVYGRSLINAMYGSSCLSKLVSLLLHPLVCQSKVLSHLYGFLQKTKLSQAKIRPFIKEFHLDEREFLDSVDSYKSFNDFFIRKLKPSARPITGGDGVAVLPADARYLFYPNIEESDGFLIKGQKFSLNELLQDSSLAQRYKKGSMVIARLCPSDYHRFHFPCRCIPSGSSLLNGALSSVNPLALKKNIEIFSENKRALTHLSTDRFGEVLFLEIGATCVGGISQTYHPGSTVQKGEEKGYFSFGGSSLILLFEPGKIIFDQDLISASEKKIEIRGLLGQSMGRSTS